MSTIDEQQLLQWIEQSINTNTNTLASGYQGRTLLYKNQNQQLVIKMPHGRGITGLIHRRMLRHEHQVYQHLKNYQWAPSCLGLVNNTYLVLEYIDAKSIRDQRPDDETVFFQKLLNAINSLHDIGVAHLDLKRKDNLLVTNDNSPCIIDFGTAVIKKGGYHPINKFLFKLARRFDYNAWIKHKYHNNMDNITDDDQQYYKRTLLEQFSSKVKHAYTGVRQWLKN